MSDAEGLDLFHELSIPRRLYHCTHEGSLENLRLCGLAPEFAAKGDSKVWLCERHEILNVAEKVAKQHGWPPTAVVVVAVNTACLAPKITAHGKGWWFVRERVPGTRLMAAWRPLVIQG